MKYSPHRLIHENHDIDPAEIPRNLDGRRHRQGEWLERLVKNYLFARGYSVRRNITLFDAQIPAPLTETFEIDVFAKHPDKDETYLIQCKDWHVARIYPSVIRRLCTLAAICDARPVICHSTVLSPTAEQLARYADVLELPLTRIVNDDRSRSTFKPLESHRLASFEDCLMYRPLDTLNPIDNADMGTG